VILVCSVRKIETRDVHAEAEQVAHVRVRVAGRADGANDFRAAAVVVGNFLQYFLVKNTSPLAPSRLAVRRFNTGGAIVDF
jgi:hypothetical protein